MGDFLFKTMKEIKRDVPDVSLIAPYIGGGLVKRVIEAGGIPEKGPGRYRIANIMSKIYQTRDSVLLRRTVSPEDDKKARRTWNLGNIMSRHRNR